MTTASNLLSSIGNTPLVELKNLSPGNGVRVLVKLEGSNPGGSVKDRAAVWMIRQAIRDGRLRSGGTILEATSGNTGIGLAMVGAALGFGVRLVMPSGVSLERRQTLEAFGADLVLTDGVLGTDGAVEEVERIQEDYPGEFFVPDQYSNPANWMSHYESTSLEILAQTNGEFDAFVAGMGTGGTLMGHSRRFAELGKGVEIVGVEPVPGHSIQGLKNMTESKVPGIFDRDKLSRVVLRDDSDAFRMTRQLARQEGLFVGLSGGAAVSSALEVAAGMKSGQTVVVIAPDRGDRYFSTGVFLDRPIKQA